MDTPAQVEKSRGKHIVFFDGYCNLCNGAVNFIIDYDKSEQFLFASLQSSFGQQFLKGHNLVFIDSIVVLSDKNEVFIKSKAAFFIAKRLNGWPKFLYAFNILPSMISDFFYDKIAAIRYTIFGKRTTCRLPTQALKQRFLDTYQNS